MPPSKKIHVSKNQQGWRLDKLIAHHYPCSRKQAEGLITQKSVISPNTKQILKTGLKVKAKQCYILSLDLEKKEYKASLLISEKNKEQIVFYKKNLSFIYEDKHILVIDKPAPLVTHPGAGKEEITLTHILQSQLSSDLLEENPLRPGVVHRLDKGVSGLMIFAKSLKAQKKLISQFKQKQIIRIYRALVIGSAHQQSGTIQSWIGRHPKHRKKFYSFKSERTGAKKAITHYQILDSFHSQLHHIECQLETGRTHQIRIHLNQINLPVLGENLYSKFQKQKKDLNYLAFKKASLSFDRLALYSAFLKFSHPITKKELCFSLNWPKEIHMILKQAHFPIVWTPSSS